MSAREWFLAEEDVEGMCERGDLVCLDRAHRKRPIMVVRRFGWKYMERFLTRRSSFREVQPSGALDGQSHLPSDQRPPRLRRLK